MVFLKSVSEMFGHRNIQTTQHYARVLDKKVSEEMKELRGKFTNKYLIQANG